MHLPKFVKQVEDTTRYKKSLYAHQLCKINRNQVGKIGFRIWSHPNQASMKLFIKEHNSGYMHLFTLTRHAGIQMVT